MDQIEWMLLLSLSPREQEQRNLNHGDAERFLDGPDRMDVAYLPLSARTGAEPFEPRRHGEIRGSTRLNRCLFSPSLRENSSRAIRTTETRRDSRIEQIERMLPLSLSPRFNLVFDPVTPGGLGVLAVQDEARRSPPFNQVCWAAALACARSSARRFASRRERRMPK